MKKLSLFLFIFISFYLVGTVQAANVIPRIVERIFYLDANAHFFVRGEDYDKLQWKGPGPKPTAGQLWAILESDLDTKKLDNEAESVSATKQTKAMIKLLSIYHVKPIADVINDYKQAYKSLP